MKVEMLSLMYADDLLLLSASVRDMQSMLDMCVLFNVANNIVFNISKFSCLSNCLSEKYCKLFIGNVQLNWSTCIKYLGIHLSAGNALRIDVSNMKRRFMPHVIVF